MLLTLSLAASAFTLAPAASCASLQSVSIQSAYSQHATASVLVNSNTAAQDSTLRATYEGGQSFKDFLSATKARREGWHRIADSASVDPMLIARAREVSGSWKLLVVAVDACFDSLNSLPYLSVFSDSLPTIQLRVVLPEQGRAVQESHKSLDGRLATPTIVLINEQWGDAGCIVELPSELRLKTHSLLSEGLRDSARTVKSAYYAQNRGVGITTEFVEMLEAAASGRYHCDRQQLNEQK